MIGKIKYNTYLSFGIQISVNLRKINILIKC